MTLKIYGDSRSGNCLKVKWTAEKLGLPYGWAEVDIMQGTTRQGDFLALNPAGQVPLAILADGRALSQSNAIVLHLAEGSDLIPADAYARAKMYEWLFWEQHLQGFRTSRRPDRCGLLECRTVGAACGPDWLEAICADDKVAVSDSAHVVGCGISLWPSHCRPQLRKRAWRIRVVQGCCGGGGPYRDGRRTSDGGVEGLQRG